MCREKLPKKCDSAEILRGLVAPEGVRNVTSFMRFHRYLFPEVSARKECVRYDVARTLVFAASTL